jgi:hypothetical protein
MIALSLATACWNASAADAKLLLVRNAKTDSTCDDVVFHGRLFEVPSQTDLKSVASTLGLTLLTRTQELPYENNAPGVSSIPVGTYGAKVRTDETKKWMKGKPDRAWRLELDVPRVNDAKRTAIQFHYGKDKSWSRGCVILTGGAPSSPLVCKAEDGADSPEAAVAAVRTFVEKTLVKSDDRIGVRIVEWPDAP